MAAAGAARAGAAVSGVAIIANATAAPGSKYFLDIGTTPCRGEFAGFARAGCRTYGIAPRL
ncbi:hypothetical protein GCM10027258_61320 [Amycolatopsis stemonae]